MRCPIDHSPLSPIEYEGCIIHTCRSCGGELLSGASLSHIVRVREEVFGSDVQELIADHEPVRGCRSGDSDRNLPCPCCGTSMKSFNYASDTNVILDRCGICNAMWADHNELEHVQAILEHWTDQAPHRLATIAHDLEHTRRRTAESVDDSFQGSRFSFVNALVNRLLDAA